MPKKKSALANVSPKRELDLLASPDTDAALLGYTEARDKFLDTPFAHPRDLAREGTPFTILDAGRRTSPRPDTGEMREQIIYLVRLQDGYEHEDMNTSQVEEYDAGDTQLIGMDVNPIREHDEAKLRELLAQFGAIPNCALQQYPNKDAMRSPSHGIVHAMRWMSLADLVKARSA